MPIQTHFDKFNKRIYLTNQSDGYKKAKEKDLSILKDIKTALKTAGYPVVDSFFQGSFAVDTAINSLQGDFDIDRALIIDEGKAPEDPVDPKKIVLKVLEERNFKEPKIKKPCITADYKSINLHIDYTIYQHSSNFFLGDTYELAVGKIGSDKNNKEWSASDPKGLIEWIESTDNYGEIKLSKRKQYKRLVRYMKRWRDVNFSEDVRKKLFSIGMTIILKEQYNPNTLSTELQDDLTVLKKVVDNILTENYIRKEIFKDQHRLFVDLPKKPYRNVFQHKVEGGECQSGSDLNLGTQFKNKLEQLKATLEKALNETCEIEQCTLLNKVFGNDFLIPKKDNNNNNNTVNKSKNLGTAYFPTAGASGTSQGA